MPAGIWVVAIAGALLLVGEGAALARAVAIRRTLQHIDRLESELRAGRSSRCQGLRSLEQQLADVTTSMTRAEEGTRSTSHLLGPARSLQPGESG